MKAVTEQVKAVLEKAADYMVKKCTAETESGTYFIHADDFPEDILPPEVFAENIRALADIVLCHKPVAEADVEDGCIFIVMYLEYCPNYGGVICSI